MPPETPANRYSEEQAIKARKHEVYEKEPQPVVGAAQRPFREYLREPPPAPLAPAVKIALWVAAVLVVLLFLASLVVPRSRPRRPLGLRASLGAPEGGPKETVWVAEREEVMRAVSTAQTILSGPPARAQGSGPRAFPRAGWCCCLACWRAATPRRPASRTMPPFRKPLPQSASGG